MKYQWTLYLHRGEGRGLTEDIFPIFLPPVRKSCVRTCLVWQANAIKLHDARQSEQRAYLCGNTLILILAFLLKSLYKSSVYGLYQRAIVQTSFTAMALILDGNSEHDAHA